MSAPLHHDAQHQLIAALQAAAPYPHAVDSVELIETHISWILLAGAFAYKLKKGIDLGFLDYSTLERRRHFCEEELRLNRRTAPTLYLEVVPITGTPAQPRVGGGGAAIEWAVKMQRFEQPQLASHRLEQNTLTAHHIDRLAERVAHFHRQASVAAPASPLGSSSAVYGPMEENFRQIRALLGDSPHTAPLLRLEAWYQQQFDSLTPLLTQRKEQGYIRECHGDLHLDNIVLVDDVPVPFDGIEFNDNLRFVDVMSDVAFLVMDLDYRGRSELGWRFLDGYLQQSGDYAGLAMLRFYQLYRAMVRAKVAAIRAHQEGLDAAQRTAALATVDRYLQLALHYTLPTSPALLITHGFSGSGKSSVALALLQQWGAIRLRSDVERKRLFGLAPQQASGSAVAEGIYTASASRHTYERLAQLSGGLLAQGFHVIADATFLKQEERQKFINLANKRGVRWYLLDVTASPVTLRERIIARHAVRQDASEADLAVLHHQLQHHDPFTSEEQAHLLTLATDSDWTIAPIMAALR